MKNTITYLQLNNQFKKLVGKPLWATIVGGCTGSILGLRFGKKLKKACPVPNSELSYNARHYDGEFSMMIYCAWRVEKGSKIICGTGDCNELGELTVEGIRILHGKRVRSVHVGKIPDLCIDFDGGFTLRLFCDTKTSNRNREWYYVIMRLENKVYSATENGKAYQEAL